MTGVSVSTTPPDRSGQTGGSTTFNLVYPDNTTATLTAPSVMGGYRFQAWLKDGANQGSNPVIAVKMDANCTMTAIYAEGPPIITSQPSDLAAVSGASASFRVAAEGIGELTYQWRFNGNAIPGAIGNTYTIISVSEEHMGTYDVVISSAAGSITSNPATLSIASTSLINGGFENGFDGWTVSGNLAIQSSPPYVAAEGTQLVSFNQGNSMPNTELSQSLATTPGETYSLSFQMGQLSYISKSQSMWVEIVGTTTLFSQSFTISRLGSTTIRWIPIELNFIADSTLTTLTFRDTSTNTDSLDLLLDAIHLEKDVLWTLEVQSSPATGVSIDATPPDAKGATDGFTTFNLSYSDNTSVTLTAPSTVSTYHFQGWLQDGENLVNNPVITVAMHGHHTLTAIYAEGPPLITSQPFDVSTALGASATFQVVAEATSDLAYLWRFNGSEILGANADSYTIASVGEQHLGIYDVVISSAAGSTTSNPAKLTIASASLISGGFENGFDGWTTSGNLAIQSTSPYVPTEGNFLVSFNQGNLPPNAVLSQPFATIPGLEYRLSFQMGLIAYNSNSQSMRVELMGNTTLLSQSFTISRVGNGIVRWVPINLSFIADSSVTMLSFRDISTSTSNLDLLLDDVQVSSTMTTATAQASSTVILANDPIAPTSTASITSTSEGVMVYVTPQEPGVYELQRSRDLKAWEWVADVTIVETIPIEFIDPHPPEQRMFYRVVRRFAPVSQ